MKPLLINNLNFSNNHQQISGEIPVDAFDRLLADMPSLQESLPAVKYTLVGTQGAFHLPSLHLTVDAIVPAICQRCSHGMKLALAFDFDYVLANDEPEAFDGDDEVDWLEVSEEMDLKLLIEDELLMAYPLGPTHDELCQEAVAENEETHQPFANLKAMLAKTNH